MQSSIVEMTRQTIARSSPRCLRSGRSAPGQKAAWLRLRTVLRIDEAAATTAAGEISMALTGSCLCKKVRYRAATPPIVARACWCRLCQFIGAGSATVNAAFLKSDLVVEGETKDYVSIADSGS